MSPLHKSKAMKELYQHYPPLMTFLRHGGMRCCYKCPCKWLSTFVCASFCADGADVYAGALVDEEKGEVGKPYQPETYAGRIIGSVTQPCLGGIYRPQLDMRVGDNIAQLGQDTTSTPFALITGPFCFGGCSELCCDFNFPVSTPGNKTEGNLGKIVKLKPQSLAGGVRELFSDADAYSIQYDANADLTAEQKVTILAGQILFDYMFFDGNTEMCRSDSDGMHIYLFYCLCCGALVPCEIHIKNNGGN